MFVYTIITIATLFYSIRPILHAEHLLQQWNTFGSASTGTALLPPPPISPHHIRVRDGGKSTSTTPTGAGSGGGAGGTLLRDDRVLCRCLLGLAGSFYRRLFPHTCQSHH